MSQGFLRLDRRSFLGRIAVSAGGATAASMLPVSMLPVSLLQAREVGAAVAAPGYPESSGDWTLDDICNAYPPYASIITRSPVPHAGPTAEVAAADRMWVA